MEYDKISYEKIPTIMKRYSLNSKFAFCLDVSRKYTSPTRPTVESIRNSGGLPHTLEAFFLFSIMHEEHGSRDILESRGSMVKRILDSIDTFVTKFVELGNNDFTANLMQAFLPTQFKIQDNSTSLTSRYYYLFNFKNEKIDMKEEFLKYYEVDYCVLASIYEIFNILFTSDKKYNNFGFSVEVYEKLIKYYWKKGYIKNFIKSREQYIEFQNYTTKGKIENYPFCVKTIYQYPFIVENNNLYLPLPHILKNAFTDSLLFRITDNNAQLKTLFGKEVFENYVYELFSSLNIYESVDREPKLSKGEKLSDVFITHKDKRIFIECKTTFPRAGIRIYDEKNEETEYKSYVGNILQVYKCMKKYASRQAFPLEKCFGVVVNLIDNNMKRSEIYKRIKDYDKSLDDKEIKFIENHIKCMDVYRIEQLCSYSNKRIDEYLYEWSQDEEQRFNYGYSIQCNKSPKGLLASLNNQMQKNIEVFLTELQTQGILA